jgi:hypothetical protein
MRLGLGGLNFSCQKQTTSQIDRSSYTGRRNCQG